jgi:CDP-paratose 2-epimerase
LAWFIIAVTLGKEITIYGNGKQVRDVLYIDDLVRAFEMAAENIEKTKGQIYNIGGGKENTISVWHELRPILADLFKKEITVTFADWRPGDQPLFISDIGKAKQDFGWEPVISYTEGISRLQEWVKNNKQLFS